MRQSLGSVRPSRVLALLVGVAVLTGVVPFGIESIGVFLLVGALAPILDLLWSAARGVWASRRRPNAADDRPDRGDRSGVSDHEEDRRWSQRLPVVGLVLRAAVGVVTIVFVLTWLRPLGIGFNLTDPFESTRTYSQSPDDLAQALADPSVADASARCLTPSQAALRAESPPATPNAFRSPTCILGYVSQVRSGTFGGEVSLDDLGVDEDAPGVVVLLSLGEKPPLGAVVEASGWVNPREDFPCDRIGHACLLVTPFQFRVLHVP